MTERTYRFYQALMLLVPLLADWEHLVTAFLVLSMIEGVTNLRVPSLVNRVRYGPTMPDGKPTLFWSKRLDAEQFQRLMIAGSLYLTWIVFPEAGWFFPWFLAAMLVSSGVTNVCPSVILGRSLGFR